MQKWTKQLLLAMGVLVVGYGGIAYAQTSTSTNYGITEYYIGPGGDLDLNSASYNARATLGDLGSGNYGSTNYQLYAGFTTTDVPYIELQVNGTSIDMGVLDSTSTGTGTATFAVRTYLADGYVVYASGGEPTNESGDTISALSTPTASSQGTEQWGLNLWTNTATGDYSAFGALPQQVPDASFAFGTVSNNYNDDGLFMYDETDPIAFSNSSSGETIYTASYLLNVSPITEAGLYQTTQTFVATSTY